MLRSSLIAFIILFPPGDIHGVIHPTNSMEKEMTCEEFGQTAKFNPYSVLDTMWFVFYYWGHNWRMHEIQFLFPTAKERAYVMKTLENSSVPVNWTARMVLMKDIRAQGTYLLVEKDMGHYWRYDLHKSKDGKLLKPDEIRLKQTADNKLIGLMQCADDHVFVMCRVTQIPRKPYIQDVAARIGYRGRGGRSYLYQGHHWMPVGEADEEEYWKPRHEHEKQEKILQKMIDIDLAKEKWGSAADTTPMPKLDLYP